MGFASRLVERSGPVCLVERTNTLTASVHWEVWHMRWSPERVGPNGELLPAVERRPSRNDWGEHGWTFTSVADARQRYADLGARRRVKGGVSRPGKGMTPGGGHLRGSTRRRSIASATAPAACALRARAGTSRG